MAQQYWKDNPPTTHYQNLKLSMFVSTDHPHDRMPKLKGRAAEVKSLMPALRHIWQHYMTPGDLAHQAVLSGLRASCRMDEILAAYPDRDVLPPDAADSFVAESWMYLRSQNAAAAHFNTTLNLLIFDVTIKSHYTAHCALRARFLNPRRSWNYMGEDFMHYCRQMLGQCMQGNDMARAIVKLMEKYVRGMHIDFQAMEDD